MSQRANDMAAGQLETVLQHIHRLAVAETTRELSDRQLLDRFVLQRDDVAFAALVQRHGRLVLAVCRHVLGQVQDTEDAFQATFLVLARSAASVRKREALAGWLHGVAYRTAMKAKRDAARRRIHEGRLPDKRQQPAPDRGLALQELEAILDEEIQRLPEKYRAPFVLCCLESKSKAEAAQALGWKEGTVSGRLAQARKLLQQRLTRRGVTLSAALAAAALSQQAAATAVPGKLAAGTIKASILYSAGKTAAGALISPKVAALAAAVSRGLFLNKAKMATVLLLAAGVIASGAGLVAHQVVGAKEGQAKPPKPPQAGAKEPTKPQAEAKRQARTDRYGDPLPEGAIARLGTVRFRQGFGVQNAMFSPDGKLVASVGFRRGICFWDRGTGKLLRYLPYGFESGALALSPDGKMLAVPDFGWSPGEPRFGLYLRDATTGKPIRRFGDAEYYAQSLVFSHDGRFLLSGATDKVVRLWEVATGKELREFKGHGGGVPALAFSPDGKTVAAVGSEKSIVLWDAATGKKLGQVTGYSLAFPPNSEYSIVFSPDGTMVAAGDDRGAVRAWEVSSRKEIRIFDGKKGVVSRVTFSPDGKLLASTYTGGFISLWHVASGKEIRRWKAHHCTVSSIAFSPDGKALVTAGIAESAIRLWNVATGKELHSLGGHYGAVNFLAYSSDGKCLVSAAGRDKTIRQWNLASASDRLLFGWHSTTLDSVALSPDSRSAATQGYNDRTVRLWDIGAEQPPHVLDCEGDRRLALAFSPDSKMLATSGKDRTIRLWDVRTGHELRRLRGHRDEVRSLAFSPDGKTLACASGNNTGEVMQDPGIRLWNVATGKQLRRLDYHLGVAEIIFSPDGNLLASAGGAAEDEPMVRLWDVGTGKCLRQLQGRANRLAFTPDGRLLAGCGWGRNAASTELVLWETATGKELRRIEGPYDVIASLAFAPDGRTVATGQDDSTILMWDLTGRLKDGQLPTSHLAPADVQANWARLGATDAAKGYQALWSLVAAPEQTIPFLKDRLKPAAAPDRHQIANLLGDLDDPRFRVRERASRDLDKLAEVAAPALRKLLEHNLSPEARRRLEAFLDKVDRQVPSADQVRTLRALTVLEQIGNSAARQILERLAQGASEARLTQEARASLDRLTNHVRGSR